MKQKIPLWCAALLLIPAVASAQSSDSANAMQQAEQPQGEVNSASDEGGMHLNVVVTDKSGKPVTGLELKDFSLFDNNKPAKIVSFRAVDAMDAGPPVDGGGAEPAAKAIVVLDAINLGYLTLAQTRDEIAKFLRRNGGHLAMPASVVLLTDNGTQVLADSSSDGNALAEQLDQAKGALRAIGRSAGVNGASERFNLCIEWLEKTAQSEANDPRRKLLIWASVGWPMLDQANTRTSPEGVRLLFEHVVDVSKLLRESHIVLYSASLGIMDSDLWESYLKGVKVPDRTDSGNLNLKVLAIQSGGLVLSPDNDLAAQIALCLRDASAYYTLSFDPLLTEHSDGYHDLKVTIDRPKVKARTRTGYYNEP